MTVLTRDVVQGATGNIEPNCIECGPKVDARVGRQIEEKGIAWFGPGERNVSAGDLDTGKKTRRQLNLKREGIFLRNRERATSNRLLAF